jgi:hypothetical protein
VVKIAIGIAHAEFLWERRESLSRLLRAVPEAHVSVSKEREHASVWAKRLWEWADAQDADATILLNDDITVHPELREIVAAMVTAVPGETISLHTSVPVAASLATAGQRWLRSYWLTGPGYVLPRGGARRLLDWSAAAPRNLVATSNEDAIGIHEAWSRQRPIWGSIPAFVEHDVSVPSTLGYDRHPLRKSGIPWTSPHFAGAPFTDPSYWKPAGEPALVPNPWMTHDAMARTERLVREGNSLCVMCVARPGVVASPASDAMICLTCLASCFVYVARIIASKGP